MVDKVFGVFAELAAQHLGVDGANPRKVVRAVLGQAAGDARPMPQMSVIGRWNQISRLNDSSSS